jgi:hypothetical protein
MPLKARSAARHEVTVAAVDELVNVNHPELAPERIAAILGQTTRHVRSW